MTELLQFTLFGLMLGCVYAIASMGLVLTYTVTGVFNFAHGAVGMLAAFGYFELRVRHGMATPIALAIVVLGIAPVTGWSLSVCSGGSRAPTTPPRWWSRSRSPWGSSVWRPACPRPTKPATSRTCSVIVGSTLPTCRSATTASPMW